MKRIFVKYLALALVLSILITVGACAKPAPAPPPSVAEFEVISLDITPPEVTAGETVSITAEVKNTGDSEGSYTVVLTVDGATVETQEVTLAPGASETVSFLMAKDAPGTYEIGIGDLSSSLTVKEPALVVKEVELKYDELYQSLLQVTSQDDLDALSGQGGIPEYIEAMVKAQREIAWALSTPPELVQDYVLPVRFHPAYNLDTAYYYPEKVENWRVPMYEKAKEVIGDTTEPYQAAVRLMDWVHVNIPYLAKNQPRYLQPTLILSRGGGSCWQNATVLASLYRSVYLPARIVVGASYWSTQKRASGTGTGTELELVVMEGFWISRDWELWYKDLKVYDDTTNTFLSSGQYTETIETITQAGKERLLVKIPSHLALDHKFTITFKFAAPQGHEWVEVYIPGEGWIDADGTINQFGQGLNLATEQFDMQAYNSATKNWESSYFLYKFSHPINSLLGFCQDLIEETEQKGIDISEAKSRSNEARSIYESTSGEKLSAEERQEKGQQIYQLLGEAIVLCSSEGKSDKFYNIWDAAQESPEILASNLTKENIKSIGVLLPYNVFDVAEIKRLYAWKGYGIKPPYVNEVKREYFWLETFRSFLPRDTNLCIIIAGYDPINSQWKVTLTDLEF